jgi:phenylalanyl-tRNA synthetase beta chain
LTTYIICGKIAANYFGGFFVKLSWSWLADYIDIQDITPQELAHRLTMSGLEVSGIEDKSKGMETIVVGRIKQVDPHPNADKLSLTIVEILNQELHIVCGAKNIAAGNIVPIALEGTILPNGLKIKRTKIRGEESCGMICSESELGLSETSEGILHLPTDSPLGESVIKVLQLDEVTIDVEITPNRSDCLSHMGIARHLSAVLDRPLKAPSISLTEKEPMAAADYRVNAVNDSGCNRYCARIIRDVKIAPSPLWMQRRLEAVGIRPVNNIVDITNYVLMEIGHPLHAFDMDKLQGTTITARRAQTNEAIITLDGVERKLNSDDLVIADETRPIALAGVMGGQNTEVCDTTTSVLLEAAWFDTRVVRKMSRKTGCSSESSFRFERGTDPELGLLLALDRAAQLMTELAGGTLLKGIIDSYPHKIKQPQIQLRLARAEKVLGMPLDAKQSLSALSRLGFLVEPVQQEKTFNVRVPSFRHDVTIEEDLFEEIAEIIGYDKIPVTTPQVPMICPDKIQEQEFHKTVRSLTIGSGAQEILTYSFHSPAHFDRLRLPEEHDWRSALQLKNPLSEELSLMRPVLLPGLIETLSYNQRRGQDRIYLFEAGSVFVPEKDKVLPAEPKHLGLVLSGPQHPMHWRLGKKRAPTDFYDLKGIIENIMQRLHVKTRITFEVQEFPFLHPMISFVIKSADGKNLGWAGSLHPEAQENYKLKETALVSEIDLSLLYPFWIEKPGVKRFSRYPSALRDISLAVSDEIQAGDVIKAILSVGKELVTEVIPFDLYQGDELAPGTKSLAFSLTLQALDRTLQEEEMNQMQAKIISHLQSKFKAQQR